MNSWVISNILLNLLTFINSSVAIVLCLFIVILIIFFHRGARSAPLLLASYTACTLLMSGSMLASMSASSLLGFSGVVLSQHGLGPWCYWRGFFIHGFFCTLYDSYILQAIYRLCRVVFYRHQGFHDFSLYLYLIPVVFLFGLLGISPTLVRGDIVYLASEYYCQTPFTNLWAINYVAVRVFFLPIVLIALIYVYLLRYLRRSSRLTTNHIQQSRSNRNMRDLIIIRRLLLILIFLILLGLPSVIFLSIFIVTGELMAITYRIGWLSASFSLVFLAAMLIHLTKPVRKTFQQLLGASRTANHHHKLSSKQSNTACST